MAFNRDNLPGVSGQSIRLNNQDESKANRRELENHYKNNSRHVSAKDRKYWNSIEDNLKKYVDYRLKSIIGIFDFEELELDNSLTLCEIILKSNKNRIQDVNSLRADFISQLETQVTNLLEKNSEERTARISGLEEVRERIKDLLAKIDKEIEDRKADVINEATERAKADTEEFNARTNAEAEIKERIEALEHPNTDL
jgi:hypothetical protein